MLYVYEGSEPAIRIKGQVLRRGVPTKLTGVAAERADRHSAVRRVPEVEAPASAPEPAPEPTAQPEPAEPARPPAAVVRAWARENGLDGPARGALKPEIHEAYAKAHG